MTSEILQSYLTPSEALAILSKVAYVQLWSDVFGSYVRFGKRECRAALETQSCETPLNILLIRNGSGGKFLRIG